MRRAAGTRSSATAGRGKVAQALEKAIADPRPSLIRCKTIIGYGAPNKQGTAATHGAALGKDEVEAARKELGLEPRSSPSPTTCSRPGARPAARRRRARGVAAGSTRAARPDEFLRRMAGKRRRWLKPYPRRAARQPADRSPPARRRKWRWRRSTPRCPATIGGSADLTGSNNTKTKAQEPLTAEDYGGRYIYYGIREFGMAAAMNGMALHGGVIPYGGTFLVFSDYCRPAIRLSALQNARVIYVMTHDSIGLGEDGPTHQPIEHLQSLRLIPNLEVYRPADAVETAECWAIALAARARVLACRGRTCARCGPKRRRENLSRARRLPAARARGRAQGDPDRHRLRGRDRARRRRAARRRGRRRRRRVDAEPTRFDAQDAEPIAKTSCRRLEPRADPARLDRGRDDLRLGALHRAARAALRHRPASARRAGPGPLRIFRADRPIAITRLAGVPPRNVRRRSLKKGACNDQ
jgi:hypothetical protein